MARNEIPSYIVRWGGEGSKETDVDADVEEGAPILQATFDDKRVCGRYYVLDTCMHYRRVGVSSVLMLALFSYLVV